MTVIQSFQPVARRDSRILILGSMPGIKSLAENQYYAHPRNAFWPIMARLFDFDMNIAYSKRLMIIKQHRVALWDVVHQCQRQGSLDSNIIEASVNELEQFIVEHRLLHQVCFNGQKAAHLFKKNIGFQWLRDRGIQPTVLVSTSPAMASLTVAQKFAQWRRELMLD